MTYLKDKKVLFIHPGFHQYGNAIQKEIEEAGASVDSFSYYLSGFWYNLLYHLPLISRRLENQNVLTQYASFNNQSYDYVFIISGGMMNEGTISKLKADLVSAKFVLYLWDSVEANIYVKDIIYQFDKVISFEPKDCEIYGFTYLPLFYLQQYYTQDLPLENNYNFDITFIGLNHSDRYEIISKIKHFCQSKKFKTKICLVSTPLGYYKQKIFNFNRYRAAKKSDFHFKSLSFKEINDLYSQSRCVIDIEHNHQQGLTMRTFELLASGKKMITTNKSILNSDLYNSNNILVIDKNNPILDESFIKDKPNRPPNIEKYSVREWVKNLFSFSQK